MSNQNIPIIDFPFRGEWKAVYNPGDPRYAFDFCAMGGTENRIFSVPFLKVLIKRYDSRFPVDLSLLNFYSIF